MKRTYFVLILGLVIVSSCGKNSGSPASSYTSNSEIESIFIDHPVKGLKVKTNGNTQITNHLGKFKCNPGEEVSFYFGELLLGSSICKDQIFVDEISIHWKKIASLLQSANTSTKASIIDISSATSNLSKLNLETVEQIEIFNQLGADNHNSITIENAALNASIIKSLVNDSSQIHRETEHDPVSNAILNKTLKENKCKTDLAEQSDRRKVNIKTSFRSEYWPIENGAFYIAVTSYGDVAILIGQPSGEIPLFIGYICPRNGFNQDNQLTAIVSMLLSYSPKCGDIAKSLNATATFSTATTGTDGLQLAFRWLDGGNSEGKKFSFCKD